ncbi:MAG: hypothetical protein ABWX57_04995 [Aeromicrobium sp.]
MIRTALVVAAATIALAGCTGDDGPPELGLGRGVDLDDLTAAVLQYQRDAEPRTANLPGSRMDAALVRMCNEAVDAGEAPDVFSAYAWTARDDDGRSYDPTSTTFQQSPSPLLPTETQVAMGDCVQGWVIWDVPADTTVVGIAFARDSGEAATWSTS